MADFSFVTTRLATGAAVTTEADVTSLVQAGVTHIIDCRAEFDDAPLLAGHPALMYLWNGVPDDGAPKAPGWYDRSIRFALMALAQPRSRLYSHCAAGVNRGPSTVYAILRALGLSASVAEQLIRTARPQVGLLYRADADVKLATLGWI